MSYIAYEKVLCSATSSGSITTYTTGIFTGLVHAVYYNPVMAATSQSISSGDVAPQATVAIASEVGGLTILTLANASSANVGVWYPRTLNTSALSSEATTGASAIPLHDERIGITITSGSTTQDTKYAYVSFYIA